VAGDRDEFDRQQGESDEHDQLSGNHGLDRFELAFLSARLTE
jgi:hypothetical protein